MRFALRAKMSNKDYVDRQMKDFHYDKERQGAQASRPEGSSTVT